MLRKINRLQKDREFKKVFVKSRPITSAHLVFRSIPNRAENTRFGFVISNKIDKRSTKRNALKRRLRVISSDLVSQTKAGYDIVVLVRVGFPYPYQFGEIKKEFLSGLKKMDLLK